jgi:uncharacterized protein YbjT (DUF2867 family)
VTDKPPILVTGGTGTLGRGVVTRLLDAGRDVRLLSRRPADRVPGAEALRDAGWVVGDLNTGAGLDEAAAGAGAIVHCATDQMHSRRDLAGTRNLIAAARRHGGPHLVYISIVGVDRVPIGYYRQKFEAERLAEESGLSWTILRATQFHDLILYLCQLLARLPVMAVPAGFSFQPVDADDVAGRLSELALGPPAGRVPDFGGPETLTIVELARAYLDASGRRRPVAAVPLPGKVAGAYRRGDHLAPRHADGRRTYREFLAANVEQVRSRRPYGAARWAQPDRPGSTR